MCGVNNCKIMAMGEVRVMSVYKGSVGKKKTLQLCNEADPTTRIRREKKVQVVWLWQLRR